MPETTEFFWKDIDYASARKAYHSVSCEHRVNLACLQKQIPRALKKLHLGKDKKRINILSVGAADGFVDQKILNIVDKGYLNVAHQSQDFEILNTAVEPNADFIGQYKSSIEKLPKNMKFDLKHMSFEEYADGEHDQNQYDMIHALHSLCHMDCLDSTLNHFYHNELAEKGLIACFLGNDSDLFVMVTSILKKLRPGYERSISDGNSAKQVLHFVEKNMMKYERFVVPYTVNLTSVFDEKSEEGNHILNFLTGEKDFRHTADQNEVEKIFEALKDLSTVDENGRFIMKVANELILIYKNSD